jgi:hypothetical protein
MVHYGIRKRLQSLIIRFVLAVFLGMMSVMVIFTASCTQKPLGKSFTSPDEAVKALIDALKQNNDKQLISILGPEGKNLIYSGDEVADQSDRACFIQKFEEKHHLDQKNPTTSILYVGEEDWPLPIPMLKTSSGWYFDTAQGKEEILNRRIGKNELNVIKVMEAYVDAQREYVRKDWNANGVMEFAQKLVSTEGKKDGLYWPVKEGDKPSPFGPLIAQAVNEGYKKEEKALNPYHGYYYKILHGQGKNTTGGEYTYVEKNKMVLGFGLVAYPAKHGNSGIMTFIVNQKDAVYEKDLGPDTEKIVNAMEKYDPDQTWKKVEKEFLPAS